MKIWLLHDGMYKCLWLNTSIMTTRNLSIASRCPTATCRPLHSGEVLMPNRYVLPPTECHALPDSAIPSPI